MTKVLEHKKNLIQLHRYGKSAPFHSPNDPTALCLDNIIIIIIVITSIMNI